MDDSPFHEQSSMLPLESLLEGGLPATYYPAMPEEGRSIPNQWDWDREEKVFVEGNPSPASLSFVPSLNLPINWELLSLPTRLLDGSQTPSTTDFGSATPALSDISLSESNLPTVSSNTPAFDAPRSGVAIEDHHSGANGKRRLDQETQHLATKRAKYFQDSSPSGSSVASPSTLHHQHGSPSSSTVIWTDYRAPVPVTLLPMHRDLASLETIPRTSRITLDPVPPPKKIPRPMNEFMLFRKYYINNIHMPGDISDSNLSLSKKICMLSCLCSYLPPC